MNKQNPVPRLAVASGNLSLSEVVKVMVPLLNGATADCDQAVVQQMRESIGERSRLYLNFIRRRLLTAKNARENLCALRKHFQDDVVVREFLDRQIKIEDAITFLQEGLMRGHFAASGRSKRKGEDVSILASYFLPTREFDWQHDRIAPSETVSAKMKRWHGQSAQAQEDEFDNVVIDGPGFERWWAPQIAKVRGARLRRPSPARSTVNLAITELWPAGVPQHLHSVKRDEAIQNWCKRNGYTPPSRSSISRTLRPQKNT